MPQGTFFERIRSLGRADKLLLTGFLTMAVVTLGLGILFGTVTAFARAGFVVLEAERAYQMMTLHGVTIFFYWLYFVQAALLLVLAATHSGGPVAIAWRSMAWLGFALMVAGFASSEGSSLSGLALLYNAPPDLVSGHDRTAVAFFYLGYLLLGLGLLLVAVPAIWTLLKPRLEGQVESWSSVAFAAAAWAGLLIVSALAAVNAFASPLLWALGEGELTMSYTMGWNLLFHNVHYLPLMATVVMWYVLIEVLTGVKSIFGQRFSKLIFASYLLLVPPTSLYHMFLEPDLAETVRVTGSLLSLFISVPTVLVFLLIVASLEVHARANGGSGLFGWIRMLPWRNPVMAAVGMAVVNLALGGTFSFVLIQEQLAPLLSDTFFVPAYFHFLTLGTVTLTFVASLLYVIPAITGRALWRPALLAKLPYVMTFGLILFGGGGLTAGAMGVPRRVIDISYQGAGQAGWMVAMSFVGIGAVFMALAMAVYIYALTASLLATPRGAKDLLAGLPSVRWGDAAPGLRSAYLGPLAVFVLVGGMYAFTAFGFEMISRLPLQAMSEAH
jgi:cytochrome c oxidase subunit 1